MPKSDMEQFENTRTQTEEELCIEVPLEEQSNISHLVKRKKQGRNEPTETSGVEQEATETNGQKPEIEKEHQNEAEDGKEKNVSWCIRS